VTRKLSSTAVQEELYPLPRDISEHDARERETFDDARLVDLEAEQESPFLRGQKRVSVRRGSLPKKTAARLMWAALTLVVLAILGAAGALLYDYGKHSWRFRIDSSDQIEVAGAEHVSHTQIMEVMGGDIGRNIFFVPLALRQKQLEQIPWVESASVMRFVPNRLRIQIHERMPVAFARIGSHIWLIDAGGTLMELIPGKRKYSFPVIAGMNAGETLSTRAARMKSYNALVRDLDSSGAHYSQELSEVDISDPEDVKVMTADANGEVLVHLGSGHYLQRYTTYVTHVQQWRQQFEKLESVDLRYDGQIIVNPDINGIARQPALTPAAAKAAMAAGVKTAAIVNYEKYVTHPAPITLSVKKEMKPTAKAASNAPIHHAATNHGSNTTAIHAGMKLNPAAGNSSVARPKEIAKPKENLTVARTTQAPHPAVSNSHAAATSGSQSSVPRPATPTGKKKPSAAIPKETTQN
jgi:cell division protein FtsQ